MVIVMIMRSTLAALAVLVISTAAFAEDKTLTTFDFTVPITQLDGKPFTVSDDLSDAEKPIVSGLLARGYTIGKPTETTLASIAQNILLADIRGEESDYIEKAKKFNLATAIAHDPKKVLLNAQQITMLEKMIGKAYNPLVVGQVLKVIDPNALSN